MAAYRKTPTLSPTDDACIAGLIDGEVQSSALQRDYLRMPRISR